MNINFQTITGQKTSTDSLLPGMEAEERKISLQGGQGIAKSQGFAVDLGRSGFTDNAYANHARSMDDIAQMADNTDAFLQHNYMALLSNTVSEEDFAKAMENGFDIRELDVKETVTIVDRIKSELLKSGVEVSGFNDDMSVEKLSRITGSMSFANELADSFHENDIPVTAENVKAAKTAFDQVKDIDALDDSAVKFMVLNNMEPTMENIYFAAHSTNGQNATGRGFYAQETSGYYAQKAENIDFEQLSPQIDRVIKEAGLDPEDTDIKDNAKWMVMQGIPLTAENLRQVSSIKDISFPVSEDLAARAAASAIADGKKAIEGNLREPVSNLQKAVETAEEVKNITVDDLKNTIISGKELTIRNISESGEAEKPMAEAGKDGQISPEANDGTKAFASKDRKFIASEKGRPAIIPKKDMPVTSSANVRSGMPTAEESEKIPAEKAEPETISDNDRRLVSARLQLEEVRLRMTTEANKRLLDRGFSIDTAPMEELIERLKGVMEQLKEEVPGQIVDEATDVTPKNSELVFGMTISRVHIIAEGPADLAGEMADEFKDASLMKISIRAESMVSRFRQAGEGYEKLMTAPRADLGDSIKKAFRNVDEILKDLDRELTEENRRTVRILGYNQMEINEENFEKVRSWDLKLQSTISRLKPGAVLDMIREGKNPLKMTIDELSQNLDQNSSSSDENRGKDEDRYARFLYKLEHKGDITQEEKKSFIGIYRLFHRLKVTDYEAIGSLLKTDQKMTIRNLLNATRNQKASRRGMDYTVDDSFGGITPGNSGDKQRIDEQIEAAFRYYRSEAEIVYENLEPEKLKAAKPVGDTLLPELAEELAAAETDKELDRDYVKEQVRQIRQTASLKAAEPAIDELKAVDVALTYNNLEAMISARRDRRNGNIWDRLRNYKERDQLREELDSENYADNYLKILDNISDKLSEELMNESDSYIDVRSIALLQKQISVMAQGAKNDSFEVPVEIEGQTISMHVTLTSDKNSNSRIDASVQTEEYGLIRVSLSATDNTVGGTLTTTNSRSREQSEYMEDVRTRLCEILSERLKDVGADRENIVVLYNTQFIPASAGQVSSGATEGVPQKTTDTNTLLKMAKAFVEAL